MRGQKPKSDTLSNFEAEDATLTLFQFHLNTNQQINWFKKLRLPWGNNPYYPDDGDVIWCVFDRDDNTNDVLTKARTSATKEGYRIAFSNPSFEIWFLLHFCNQVAEVENCDAVIRLLKQKNRLESYEKNQNVYELLKPLQHTAIQRAKMRTDQLSKERTEIISRQSNPATSVAELVEYLNAKR